MVPAVEEIPYIEPASLISHLSQYPGLCFLDSARSHPDCGRFSFVVLDPFLMVSAKDGMVTVGDQTLAADPFVVLQDLLKKYPSSTQPDLPPFQGGVVGYWGYGLLQHTEDIDLSNEDVIDVPDMKVGFYDTAIAFDHFEKKTWLISQGFPCISIGDRKQRASARLAWLSGVVHAALHAGPWQECAVDMAVSSNMSKQAYGDAVQKTIDYIYAGDIFQANISQCFSGVLPEGVSAVDLYQMLRVRNPAPFAAMLCFDEVQVASASPERFLSVRDGVVETRPIKGTRPRGKSAIADQRMADALLSSEKDVAENTMIVDLMRNDLSKVCVPGSVHVKKLCGLESYETVHHLVSVIHGVLRAECDAMDLLKVCFPGGSITGAPKVRAMEIIEELESMARGVYCGSIGYMGFDGAMDTSIVIRTYTVTDRTVYFHAGGGVVADSKPADEYEESLAKAHALRALLTCDVA